MLSLHECLSLEVDCQENEKWDCRHEGLLGLLSQGSGCRAKTELRHVVLHMQLYKLGQRISCQGALVLKRENGKLL